MSFVDAFKTFQSKWPGSGYHAELILRGKSTVSPIDTGHNTSQDQCLNVYHLYHFFLELKANS